MQIFLSATAEDARIAEQLSELLARRGVHIQSSLSVPVVGQRLTDTVVRAISASDAVVVVLTGHWKRAKGTAFETGAAVAMAKPLIPIVIGTGVDVPIALSNFLAIHIDDVAELPTAAQEVMKAVERMQSSGAKIDFGRVDVPRALDAAAGMSLSRQLVSEYEINARLAAVRLSPK